MATPASYERFAELDEERYESDPRYRAAYDEYAKYNIVPEGAYLLLGDNSPNSRDGRVWGWLPKENILGRVASVWWPPNHWRDFTGFSETWWWRALVALAGILLFWRLFLGRSARVHSTAPAAGLREGDHVHVDRFSYGPPIPFTSYRLPFGREPRRGELVLYRAGKDNDDWLMGRIAAAPGDVISFQDDKLYIAGRQDLVPASLRDRAFPGGEGRKPYGRSKRKQMTEVPANHWFILSEAEESAIDSRNFGWVRKNQLVGRVNAVWWPPTRWRRLRRS
jgi:signal peptidase I